MQLTSSNPSIPGSTMSVSTRSTARSPSNCKAPSAVARTSISKSPPSGFRSADSRACSINSTSVALSSTIRIVNGALDLVLVDRISETPPRDIIFPFLTEPLAGRHQPHREPSTPASCCSRLPLVAPEYYMRSEEHTSELQSPMYLVCRLLLEKKNRIANIIILIRSLQLFSIYLYSCYSLSSY